MSSASFVSRPLPPGAQVASRRTGCRTRRPTQRESFYSTMPLHVFIKRHPAQAWLLYACRQNGTREINIRSAVKGYAGSCRVQHHLTSTFAPARSQDATVSESGRRSKKSCKSSRRDYGESQESTPWRGPGPGMRGLPPGQRGAPSLGSREPLGLGSSRRKHHHYHHYYH